MQASRRPADTPFKQQRLNAWQPILTPKWVIGTFLLIGIIFIPVGVDLKAQSDSVVEAIVQYDGKAISGRTYQTDCSITSNNEGKQCVLDITVDKDMKAPVYLYYELSNFYQNHRKYVKSLSFSQLRGDEVSAHEIHEDCKPLDIVEPVGGGTPLTLNPCGLVANSLFNDVISLSDGQEEFTLDETNIAWESDVTDKFNQPEGFKMTECGCTVATGSLEACSSLCSPNFTPSQYECGSSHQMYQAPSGKCYAYQYPNDDVTQYLYESYPKIVSPIEGVESEHFIVWMRTAGLPTFRKLYGKIDENIPAGTTIQFNIDANFNVVGFEGTKSIVLSTVSWFGGKNSFLGTSYIVVGSICIALAAAFGIKHAVSPRRLGDTRYLVWKEA